MIWLDSAHQIRLEIIFNGILKCISKVLFRWRCWTYHGPSILILGGAGPGLIRAKLKSEFTNKKTTLRIIPNTIYQPLHCTNSLEFNSKSEQKWWQDLNGFVLAVVLVLKPRERETPIIEKSMQIGTQIHTLSLWTIEPEDLMMGDWLASVEEFISERNLWTDTGQVVLNGF